MLKKYFFTVMVVFFPIHTVAGTLYDLSPDLKISMENHLRISGNILGNNLDLDNDRSDGIIYMGYTYDLRFNLEYKDILTSFVKLESNGPFDFDAPVMSDRKINTFYGKVDNYSIPEVIPRVEEYWVDSMVFHFPLRFKIGQYPYQVGNGYALCGYYENYGLSVYSTDEDFKWTVYYARPDLANKIILGPQVPQERALDVEYDSNTHFLSFDAVIKWNEYLFQPYIGLLHDTTPGNRRVSAYPFPVNEDNLGTIGIDIDRNIDRLNFGFEVAKNFGRANIAGEDSYIVHKGYMAYADVSYSFGKITPRSKLLVSSGNKMDADDVINGRFHSHSNYAFSVYSPTNANLSDAIYPAAYGPYLATGGGYAMNYGIARPSIFGDAYQLNDLILPNIGVDIQITDKWSVSIDYWYLRSFEHAIGLRDSRPVTLSSDLGHELDFYGSYDITKNISFNLLTGIFFPGKYYHEKRDDRDILGLAPAPRFDGGADIAYQIEFATEITF
ncbi:MAG: alginate export family protein [Candidatus Brocadia sp.]